MPPKKHPKVDYLRVYPGLNDFSDALEAIPLDMMPYMTLLKDIESRTSGGASSGTPPLAESIDDYFRAREPQKLARVSSLLFELMPAVEQKMHAAALAAEVMARQVERLTTDYHMACEHEIPQEIQLDPNDRAFMQIGVPEKQTTARSQARREAREAREARRVAQQESRAGTPLASTPDAGVAPPAPAVSARRRERTGTPQSPQPSAPVPAQAHAVPPVPAHAHAHVHAHVHAPAHAHAHAPAASPAAPAPAAVPAPVQPAPPRHEGRQLRRHAAEESGAEDVVKQDAASAVPPVVMPIAAQTVESAVNAKKNGDMEADVETAAAEAVSGLKRKRGVSPKDARNEPMYCYCEQGSFGEMVACDGPSCQREWFHLGCLGLSALPKGQWFCEDCQAKFRRR